MNAPRIVSRPSELAAAASAIRSTNAPRTRICAVVSCSRTSAAETRPSRRPPASTNAVTSHGHREPAEQREPRAGAARVAREEQREDDDRAEVGDRGAGDHGLAERRRRAARRPSAPARPRRATSRAASPRPASRSPPGRRPRSSRRRRPRAPPTARSRCRPPRSARRGSAARSISRPARNSRKASPISARTAPPRPPPPSRGRPGRSTMPATISSTTAGSRRRGTSPSASGAANAISATARRFWRPVSGTTEDRLARPRSVSPPSLSRRRSTSRARRAACDRARCRITRWLPGVRSSSSHTSSELRPVHVAERDHHPLHLGQPVDLGLDPRHRLVVERDPRRVARPRTAAGPSTSPPSRTASDRRSGPSSSSPARLDSGTDRRLAHAARLRDVARDPEDPGAQRRAALEPVEARSAPPATPPARPRRRARRWTRTCAPAAAASGRTSAPASRTPPRRRRAATRSAAGRRATRSRRSRPLPSGRF